MTDPIITMKSINAQIGLDGKTGLPAKVSAGLRNMTNYDLTIKLRDQDKDWNVNLWDWANTQLDLTSQDINRLLYYNGQLAFAYIKEMDEFVLLPFTSVSNLDFYGRPKYIRLIPYFTDDDAKKVSKPVHDFFANKKFRVVNTIKTEVTLEDLENSAVILRDRTPDLSGYVTPQAIMNKALIEYEAEIYTFMRTNLINATGVTGIKVNGQDEEQEVLKANVALVHAAKTAQKYVPIVSKTVDLQELVQSNGNTQEFLQAAQAIHNLRMTLNGLPASGVYDKSQYVSKPQVSLNAGSIDAALVLQDKYTRRDEFCNIVASIWGIGIDCLPSENIVMADLDNNGVAFDDQTDNHSQEVKNDGMDN